MIAGGLGIVFCLAFMTVQVRAQHYPWMGADDYVLNQALVNRIPAPAGFDRMPVQEGGFAQWLRQLPLRPEGSQVRVYPVESGGIKKRTDVHQAVVDLDVLRFQECADAIIRLRTEYLWAAGMADSICFHFTSGDACCWKKWKEGRRPTDKIDANPFRCISSDNI